MAALRRSREAVLPMPHKWRLPNSVQTEGEHGTDTGPNIR